MGSVGHSIHPPLGSCLADCTCAMPGVRRPLYNFRVLLGLRSGSHEPQHHNLGAPYYGAAHLIHSSSFSCAMQRAQEDARWSEPLPGPQGRGGQPAAGTVLGRAECGRRAHDMAPSTGDTKTPWPKHWWFLVSACNGHDGPLMATHLVPFRPERRIPSPACRFSLPAGHPSPAV